MKLYELTAAYRQIDAASDEDMDDAEFMALVQQIEGAIKDKATGIAMVVQNLEATAESIKGAEKRMADRRKVLESRAASIRKYLLDNMVAGGIHSVACDHFVLKVRDNPPSVLIEDESKIPVEYMRQPSPVPDKRAMLDDMKQGVVIDGVSMGRGQRLEIK